MKLKGSSQGSDLGFLWRPFRSCTVAQPEGTIFQPEEHALELGRAQLLELQDALAQMDSQLLRRSFRDSTIWPMHE